LQPFVANAPVCRIVSQFLGFLDAEFVVSTTGNDFRRFDCVFESRTARSVCVHAGEEDVAAFLSAGDQFETDA
jgi:hypothetical protein